MKKKRLTALLLIAMLLLAACGAKEKTESEHRQESERENEQESEQERENSQEEALIETVTVQSFSLDKDSGMVTALVAMPDFSACFDEAAAALEEDEPDAEDYEEALYRETLKLAEEETVERELSLPVDELDGDWEELPQKKQIALLQEAVFEAAVEEYCWSLLLEQAPVDMLKEVTEE